MMPHPERMVDNLISNTDGINLFAKYFKIMKIDKVVTKHGLTFRGIFKYSKAFEKRT